MKTLVSEKGQVTIPKAIRDRLGLHPGTTLDFTEDAGRLIGVKTVAEDVFRKWRGRGKLPAGIKDVDAFIQRARGGP